MYIPHEASKYHDSDLFDELAEDIINIKSKYDAPICMIGDFNSRTGNLDDFIILEEQISEICNLDSIDKDIFNSKQYFEEHGLNTKRCNKDTCTNNNGFKLIELCRCLDLKFVNGRIGNDKNIGDFTCSSAQGSSSVDYCIASSEFFPYFQNFIVDIADKNLSDVHSPISLTFRTDYVVHKNTKETESISPPMDYFPLYTRWDESLSLTYRDSFDADSLLQLNVHLNQLLLNGANQTPIDETIELFKNLFITSSTNLGMTKKDE